MDIFWGRYSTYHINNGYSWVVRLWEIFVVVDLYFLFLKSTYIICVIFKKKFAVWVTNILKLD